jgi:DNA-binding GntR family transcriptional regulator
MPVEDASMPIRTILADVVLQRQADRLRLACDARLEQFRAKFVDDADARRIQRHVQSNMQFHRAYSFNLAGLFQPVVKALRC